MNAPDPLGGEMEIHKMYGSRTRRALVATVTTLAVSGGVVVGTQAPVSAHTGDLKVSVICDDKTGQYNLKAELTTSKVPAAVAGSSRWRVGNTTFDGTPTSNNGMDRGPVASSGNQTIILGTWSLPGNTTGYGPWVYAYTQWSNGVKKGSDGRLLQKLDGGCKPKAKYDASASISTNPATCTTPEMLVYGEIQNATWSGTPDGTQGPGSYSTTATGNSGPPPHLFPAGPGVSPDGTTKSFSGQLSGTLDPNDYPDCRPEQPKDEELYQKEPGCDLSQYGDFKAGVIERSGLRTYDWDKEARKFVPVDEWGDWTQKVTWTRQQQVKNGCITPVQRPTANLRCGCKGDPSGMLNNTRSDVTTVYDVKVKRGNKTVRHFNPRVLAGEKRAIFTGHAKFRPGDRIIVNAKGMDRVVKRVPPRCPKIPSGLRLAPKGR